MKKILDHILILRIFRKHRNALPNTSEVSYPKMEYHALTDALFWEDEGLRECHPDLENVFRHVIHYRTSLITGESTKVNKQYFELAKKYFPLWIGFNENRCSFSKELSDRITRLRKVADWRIDRLLS